MMKFFSFKMQLSLTKEKYEHFLESISSQIHKCIKIYRNMVCFSDIHLFVHETVQLLGQKGIDTKMCLAYDAIISTTKYSVVPWLMASYKNLHAYKHNCFIPILIQIWTHILIVFHWHRNKPEFDSHFTVSIYFN